MASHLHTTVAAPSASESRKHMKVVSVQRTGLPVNSSIFSIAPMQHRSQLSHLGGGRGDYLEQSSYDENFAAVDNTRGLL